MKKIVSVAAAAVLGLSVAACDGANEDAMEETGDEMVDATEAEADALEDSGAITDGEADAMVDEAEATADSMEETGEAVDDAM